MAAPKKAPSASISLLRILRGYAQRMGIDFSAIAVRAGLDLSIFGDDRARVSAKKFAMMWRQTLAAADDPHAGLKFGQEMARHYPGGSILFTMMMNCATIGGALDALVRYHRIMADIIQPILRRDGIRIGLSWDVSQPGVPSHPQVAEALICTYHSILDYLSQGALRPIEVCFTHAVPADMGAYRQVFKAPIIFNAQSDELIFATDALDLKIHLANRELYEVLENHAIRIADSIAKVDEWSNQVIRLTASMVIKGIKPDIDSVANKLALSRRNLQAKLKAEQTTFRRCVETVRQQTALDYLARPGVTIGDVAFMLGYSEQSAFNHAFKRWTGKSPTAYADEL